jgi:hypothetical protein
MGKLPTFTLLQTSLRRGRSLLAKLSQWEVKSGGELRRDRLVGRIVRLEHAEHLHRPSRFFSRNNITMPGNNCNA